MSIICVLRGPQGVPQKNKLQLEALRRLADHSRNYHEYRSRLRNTAPPAVPFLGEVNCLQHIALRTHRVA